jgi:signal transduction histidine kinase
MDEALQRAHSELETRVQERTAELAKANAALRAEFAERMRVEEALRQRNRELALLNRAGQALNSSLELDQVLATVLEEVRRLLGVAACSIWLIDPATGELVCWQTTDPQSGAVRGWPLAPGQGLAGWVVRHGESLIVPDAQADERYFQDVGQRTGLDLRSILSVPLKVKGCVTGVLQVVDTQVDRFGLTDLELTEPLAASAAIAIENARLFEAARAQLRLARTLQEVGALLTTRMSLDEVFERLFDLLAQVVDYDSVSVHLPDQDGKSRLVAWRGFPDPEASSQLVRTFDLHTMDESWGQRNVVVIPDTQVDDRWIVAPGLETIRSWIGVKLVVKDQLIGVLNVDSVTPDAYDAAVGQTVAAFANQAAIAIENTRLHEAVSEQRARLRALAVQVAEAEEAERRRLARELHDQVGQNLTALGINLNIVRTQVSDESAGLVRSRLDDSLVLVEQTTERIRDVMADLRPPVLDDYGLVAVLHWYGEQCALRTGLAIEVLGQEPDLRLPTRVENALFRIAQEALTNVTKHAQAVKVTVALEIDDQTVRLVVADDGVGFNPTRLAQPDGRQAWGLITMSERAEAVDGHCRIESRLGQGTRVVVEVPR